MENPKARAKTGEAHRSAAEGIIDWPRRNLSRTAPWDLGRTLNSACVHRYRLCPRNCSRSRGLKRRPNLSLSSNENYNVPYRRLLIAGFNRVPIIQAYEPSSPCLVSVTAKRRAPDSSSALSVYNIRKIIRCWTFMEIFKASPKLPIVILKCFIISHLY